MTDRYLCESLSETQTAFKDGQGYSALGFGRYFQFRKHSSQHEYFCSTGFAGEKLSGANLQAVFSRIVHNFLCLLALILRYHLSRKGEIRQIVNGSTNCLFWSFYFSIFGLFWVCWAYFGVVLRHIEPFWYLCDAFLASFEHFRTNLSSFEAFFSIYVLFRVVLGLFSSAHRKEVSAPKRGKWLFSIEPHWRWYF